MKKMMIRVIFLVLFLVLTVSLFSMPTENTVFAPSYNDTTWYYIENSVRDTGAINLVAALITDYRAFDTLGETIVLFTSIVAVISVLRISKNGKEE